MRKRPSSIAQNEAEMGERKRRNSYYCSLWMDFVVRGERRDITEYTQPYRRERKGDGKGHNAHNLDLFYSS